MSEKDFFKTQSEQSAVKAKIVSDYYLAWSRVIQKWDTPMAYIDLFCGLGKYEDDKLAAPLLVLKSTLSNPSILSNMRFVFNDMNPDNIISLKKEITKMDSQKLLSGKISFYNEKIDVDFYTKLKIPPNMPVLSFVDPFGYKGLTMNLINLLISNKGSDCIFFFNYNRVNMALSSNTKFDEHLYFLFGEERTTKLKQQLSDQPSEERELLLLDSLIEALRENKINYVLPFKFYGQEQKRTSHFIIFATKHKLGCKIMKQIMYNNSEKDADGVAAFLLKDKNNFGQKYEQLSLFDRPIQALEEKLINEYQGKPVKVEDVCDEIDYDFTNNFTNRNVKEVFRRLELDDRLTVISGRKRKTSNGKLTMPNNAVVLIK